MIAEATKQRYLGKRYGHLTIIGFAEDRKFKGGQTQAVALCKCDCGMLTEKLLGHVRSGATSTCGTCRPDDLGGRKPKELQVWHSQGDSLYTYVKGRKILIDKEDYPLIKGKLCIDGSGYVAYGRERLHTTILKPNKGECVDHINGNKLDNRKSNLRICNQSSNSMNTVVQTSNKTGYKGVHPARPALDGPRYTFQVTKDNKRYYHGSYKTPEEAARAYDEMSIKLHGPYACINFPEEHPDHLNRRPARRIP